MGDIASNLFAHWRFLEGSGTTVADSSGNGRGLTLTNGPTWGSGPFGAAPAVTFDGTNDYGASTAALDLSSSNVVTVAAWCKITDNNSQPVLWEQTTNYNSFTTGLIAYTDTVANTIHYGHKGDVGYSEFSSSFSGWAAWHHVVAVHDKSATTNEVTLYIDGTAQSRTAGAGNNNNTNNFANAVLYLMSRAGTTAYNAGSLADVRVYSRALAAADVTDLYAWRGVGAVFYQRNIGGAV